MIMATTTHHQHQQSSNSALSSLLLSLRHLKLRVCNGDDSIEVKTKGLCLDTTTKKRATSTTSSSRTRTAGGLLDEEQEDIARQITASILNYNEIRFAGRDWDSPIIANWMLQIILTEILMVPTSVESYTPSLYEKNQNYYNPFDVIDYNSGKHSFTYKEFERSTKTLTNNVNEIGNGDCRDWKDRGKEEEDDDYVGCSHVATEAWQADRPWIQDYIKTGVLEPINTLNLIGGQWYVHTCVCVCVCVFCLSGQ